MLQNIGYFPHGNEHLTPKEGETGAPERPLDRPRRCTRTLRCRGLVSTTTSKSLCIKTPRIYMVFCNPRKRNLLNFWSVPGACSENTINCPAKMIIKSGALLDWVPGEPLGHPKEPPRTPKEAPKDPRRTPEGPSRSHHGLQEPQNCPAKGHPDNCNKGSSKRSCSSICKSGAVAGHAR